MQPANQVFPNPSPLLLRQAVDGVRVVAGNVFFVNHPADVLVGKPGSGIVVPFLAGEHFGDRLVRGRRLQQVQGDGLVADGVLLLFALPFLAGQAAHVVVEAAGRTVVVLHHLEVLETVPQQYPVAVHSEMVRELRPSGEVAGDLRAQRDGVVERLLSEVAPEQVVCRAMRVAERRRALAMMQAVAQHVADGREDVVIAVQREQEMFRIEEGPGPMMPVAMEFGNPHLQPLAEEDHPLLLGGGNSMQMRGHDGVRPQLHPAGKALQRQDVCDVPNVLAVPEQDFAVASDAEMIQSFHDGKVNIFRYIPGDT